MLSKTGRNVHRVVRTGNLPTFLRPGMPVAVLLFSASFNWSYVKWISVTWASYGLTYHSPNQTLLTLGYFLPIVLSLLSPLRIRRPSHVIYWLLFFLVYIPGMFVPLYMQLDDSMTLFLIQVSLTCGMSLIAFSYRLTLLKFHHRPISPKIFWVIFFLLFGVCNLALLVVYRSNLQVASFADVYKVRFESGQVASSSTGIGYISEMLSNVLNPFLIAYGLNARRRKLIALGTLGQVLVYAIAAMKSVLVSPLFILLFYYSLKKDRGHWSYKMGLMLAGTIFFFTTLAIGVETGLRFDLASLIIVRSIAMPGLFIGQYQYFFARSAHTYLRQIHLINVFFPNPYQLPLGMEIGRYFMGAGIYGYMESNANFFATDGIAGFGLLGIPLMGLVCAAMFWVLDSCAKKYSIAFSASALTMCIISLTNTSLFATFLSGGLMAWMLLFIFMPRNMLNYEPNW